MIETDDLIGFDSEDYEAGGTGWAAESASEIPEDTAGKGEFLSKASGTCDEGDGACGSLRKSAHPNVR